MFIVLFYLLQKCEILSKNGKTCTGPHLLASVLIKNNSLKERNTFDLILEQYFNLFPNLKQLKIQVKMFTPLTCFSHCADL